MKKNSYFLILFVFTIVLLIPLHSFYVDAEEYQIVIPTLRSLDSITFDSKGNLYVADSNLDRILQYDSTGNLLNDSFVTGLSEPRSIAFDSDDNLYIVDQNLGLISTNSSVQYFLSPYKQVKDGIAITDVMCNTGLILMLNPMETKSICVTEDTSEKLLERGWNLVS